MVKGRIRFRFRFRIRIRRRIRIRQRESERETNHPFTHAHAEYTENAKQTASKTRQSEDPSISPSQIPFFIISYSLSRPVLVLSCLVSSFSALCTCVVWPQSSLVNLPQTAKISTHGHHTTRTQSITQSINND